MLPHCRDASDSSKRARAVSVKGQFTMNGTEVSDVEPWDRRLGTCERSCQSSRRPACRGPCVDKEPSRCHMMQELGEPPAGDPPRTVPLSPTTTRSPMRSGGRLKRSAASARGRTLSMPSRVTNAAILPEVHVLLRIHILTWHFLVSVFVRAY